LTDTANNLDEPKWKSTVKVVALTDIGMRRAINQDSMSTMVAESKATWERQGHFFAVADGMGAHAAGELASKLAVELIPHHYTKYRDLAPAEAMHRAITETNSEIFRKGQANIEFRSMGTTCSVLTLLPEGAVVAHVGDSRVYQLTGDQLFQLTFDHSLVWEMQASGKVTDETARSGVIPKNVITRSLGPNSTVQIDLEGPFPVRQGNRFLICSDGLSGQITDEEIAAILKLLSIEEAAQLFIDLSNLRGGPDNITAVVVEVVGNEITTSKAGSVAVKRDGVRKPFSPALAIVSGVCFLVAVVLVLIGQNEVAIFAAVLAIIAVLAGLAQVFWSPPAETNPSSRYGAGPHRQFKALATQAFFEHLASTMKPIREAAEERKWKIDWRELDTKFAKACELADSKNYAEAIRLQSQVIINLMSQIRKQREGNSADSAIDL
jgi:PPM family protein phosphatase